MEPLEIFTAEDCPQGSDSWHEARRGIITASDFGTVMAKGRGGGESLTRKKLIYTKAAEIITGQVVKGWEGNQHTERGKEMEAGVRDLYEATSAEPVTQIGFIRCGRIGCSPDSLVGEHGLLEIKTKLPHLQIEALDAGKLPSEHVAQVQGQLLVSRRLWCDFRSFWPGLPELKVHVARDPAYMSQLSLAITEFLGEVDQVVKRIKARMA